MIFGKRKRMIDDLIMQIDLILHGDDSIDISVFKEGDFYILQNEINKMTLRIREQNDALRKDKQYLADSLADIAHQLRTPLTSASLILPLLATSEGALERWGFAREMEGLIGRMDWLISSLLKLSRLDAGVAGLKSERVNALSLVKSALNPFTIPLEIKGIEAIVDVPETIELLGDFGWLSEAIQNIIKNCIENTPENGFIEITCKDSSLNTDFIIHDSGAGFETCDLPYLFDRFYRSASASGTGFGIGLALTKTIIGRQGGSVDAKNHKDGGAEFRLRFPKVTDKSF